MPPAVALDELSRAECLRLLRSRRVGRVAVTIAALPAVLPVNYAMLGDDIVFRTMPGTKLTAAAMNTVVAFEIDEADEATRSGWSVMVIGMAEEIVDPAELQAAADLDLETWVDGAADHVVRVRCDRISGRRVGLPD